MKTNRLIRLAVLSGAGACVGVAIGLFELASGRPSFPILVLAGADLGGLVCILFLHTNAQAQRSIDWLRTRVQPPKGASKHLWVALREIGILWVAFAVLEPAIKAEMKVAKMEVVGVVAFSIFGAVVFVLGVFLDREPQQ